MGVSTAAKNAMLGAISAFYFSAHTADPGDSGASEVTGGAYARVSAPFQAASAGERLTNASASINIPASTTVTFVGVWSALTSGTYLGNVDIADVTFTNTGNLVVNSGASFNLNG